MVDAMTKGSRVEKAAALEHWADEVAPEALIELDTTALRRLGELADQRTTLESELTRAVLEARRAHRSWSEIGSMLGVSKQAAQRKYGRAVSTA